MRLRLCTSLVLTALLAACGSAPPVADTPAPAGAATTPEAAEAYREARDSWKLDLRLADDMQIELFSFPAPPPRVSRPEACGLRHLALRVADIEEAVRHLQQHGVEVEAIRVDEYTGKRFTFFADPDGLPLELYED